MESSSFHLGYKLSEQYKHSCEICGSYPELKYSQQFIKGELLLDLSNLSTATLEVICHAISQSLTPFMIEVTSIKNKSSTSSEEKKALLKILKALVTTLKVSRTLSVLKFENIFIPSSMMSILCQGLAKTNHLRILHFKNCPIKYSGLEEICYTIKNVACISTLTFNNCRIDTEDVRLIKSLITHQSLNRMSMLWKDTLRAQHPNLDEMKGLRHMVLNNNPHIGDEGLKEILGALSDDIWITGVEFQNCGITSQSVEIIYDFLKVNQVLERFSLESNPFLSSEFVLNVNGILRRRNPGLESLEVEEEKRRKKDPNAVAGKSSTDKIYKSRVKLASKFKHIKRGIPWRIEGRLIESLPCFICCREGLPVGTLSFIVEEIDKCKVKAKRKNTRERRDEGISLHNIRSIIHNYKTKLKAETRRRLKAERRIKRLEKKLKLYEEAIEGSYILDESTFLHIERCFSKFQNLLIKFRQAGYQWQSELYDGDHSGSHMMRSIPVTSHRMRSQHSSKSMSYSSQNAKETSSSQSVQMYSARSSKQKSPTSGQPSKGTCNTKSHISFVTQSEDVKDNSGRGHESSVKPKNTDTEQKFTGKRKSKLKSRSNRDAVDISILRSMEINDVPMKIQKDKVIYEENKIESVNNINSHQIAKNRSQAMDKPSLEVQSEVQNNSLLLKSEAAIKSNEQYAGRNFGERNAGSVQTSPDFSSRHETNEQESYSKSGSYRRELHEEQKFKDDSDHSTINESVISEDMKEGCDSNEIKVMIGNAASKVETDPHSIFEPSSEVGISPKGVKDQNSNLERNDVSVSSAAPFNMKNLQFLSLSSVKSDSLSLSVATDDEKMSRKMTAQNITDQSAFNSYQKDTKLSETNSDGRNNSIHVEEEESKENSYSQSEATYSENKDSNSHLFSLGNSRQPSLASISQQLSLGHENWMKMRPKTTYKKGESSSEDFESDFEASDVAGVSISASSLTVSNASELQNNK